MFGMLSADLAHCPRKAATSSRGTGLPAALCRSDIEPKAAGTLGWGISA